MTLLDPKAIQKLLAENKGERVLICCDDHGYYPDSQFSRPPMLGCRHCVMADLFYEFSKVPEGQRQERSEQLEEVVHHMAEDIEAGKFDIEIFAHPQVSIEKDVDDKFLS